MRENCPNGCTYNEISKAVGLKNRDGKRGDIKFIGHNFAFWNAIVEKLKGEGHGKSS